MCWSLYLSFLNNGVKSIGWYDLFPRFKRGLPSEKGVVISKIFGHKQIAWCWLRHIVCHTNTATIYWTPINVPRNVPSLALIYKILLYRKGKLGLEKLIKFPKTIWLASGRARVANCVYFEVLALSIYDSHKKIIPNNRTGWERTYHNSILLTRTNISCIWVKLWSVSPQARGFASHPNSNQQKITSIRHTQGRWVAKALHCVPETNVMLYVNYILKKGKKKTFVKVHMKMTFFLFQVSRPRKPKFKKAVSTLNGTNLIPNLTFSKYQALPWAQDHMAEKWQSQPWLSDTMTSRFAAICQKYATTPSTQIPARPEERKQPLWFFFFIYTCPVTHLEDGNKKQDRHVNLSKLISICSIHLFTFAIY